MSSLEDSLLIVVELLSCLGKKGLVDVRNDTTSSNCCFDESIKFFVTSNSKLEMSWCDSLDLQVLACISSEFKNLSSEILEDCS